MTILNPQSELPQDGFAPWGQARRAAARPLQAQRPAIIGLQAVHAGGEQDQPRELAYRLSHHPSPFLAADAKRPPRQRDPRGDPLSARGLSSGRVTMGIQATARDRRVP